MKIKDENVYLPWKEKNQDDWLGILVFNYAEAWANLMEARLDQGCKLEDIAEETSNVASDSIGGISNFQFSASEAILYHCWIHGEDLREWFKKRYNVK